MVSVMHNGVQRNAYVGLSTETKPSDDPDDYVIEEHRPERKGDDGEAEVTYTATLKRGWKPKEPEEEPESKA